MFSENLAISLLLICNRQQLNYEQASEKCGCSARHFGSIIRKKASPTLGLLEQMCDGFGQTPNQLLGVHIEEALAYRTPTAVTKLQLYPATGEKLVFPVCPRCGGSLKQDFQAYCDSCGQCLDWSVFQKLKKK